MNSRICTNCGEQLFKEKYDEINRSIMVTLDVKSFDNLEETEHPQREFCCLDCTINHLTGVNDGCIKF